jgi:translation elongation factor P/translation initiation factor 5A
MALKKGKHITKEINGKLCTVVEVELSEIRMNFLKELLAHNKYEVEVEITENEAGRTYTLGVTDLVFNPMINVYERTLLRKDGSVVTVAYWNQTSEEDSLPYFEYREKNPDSPSEDEFVSNPWAFRTIG